MPRAVEMRLETPIKGQIPRNWVKTKLLTRAALKIMNKKCVNSYSIVCLNTTDLGSIHCVNTFNCM